jgi:hypothetical protein
VEGFYSYSDLLDFVPIENRSRIGDSGYSEILETGCLIVDAESFTIMNAQSEAIHRSPLYGITASLDSASSNCYPASHLVKPESTRNGKRWITSHYFYNRYNDHR